MLRIGLVSLTGLMFSALPIAAQRVSGEVVVVRGPVAARIEVGERPVYQRPRREVIVRSRDVVYSPRVIVVQRRHVPRGRARGWWRNEGYQRTVVWVDAYGRFYDRDYDRDYDRNRDYDRDRDHGRDRDYDRDGDHGRDRDDRRGLRPVNVYERDGQYYDWAD
jgi:hypothetical protein